MNWGMFLALVGFLLPLAVMIRLGFAIAWSGRPLARPAQAARLVALALLAVPMSGKTPAMLHATFALESELGALTEAFMVTPWGWAQTALLLTAVALVDVLGPPIVERLERAPVEGSAAAAGFARGNALRDLGIVTICLGLAWIAAR